MFYRQNPKMNPQKNEQNQYEIYEPERSDTKLHPDKRHQSTRNQEWRMLNLCKNIKKLV